MRVIKMSHRSKFLFVAYLAIIPILIGVFLQGMDMALKTYLHLDQISSGFFQFGFCAAVAGMFYIGVYMSFQDIPEKQLTQKEIDFAIRLRETVFAENIEIIIRAIEARRKKAENRK